MLVSVALVSPLLVVLLEEVLLVAAGLRFPEYYQFVALYEAPFLPFLVW
jgi:hypothetical protein